MIRPEPSPGRVAALLELSDERDMHQRLREAAYREGWRDGARDQWSAGYAAAVADVKAADHDLVTAIRLTGLRLAPGGAIWLDMLARNGLTGYGGAGRPRVPVDPEVIAQACRDLKGTTP